jgi:predicted lipid-binding transport protein (Tim44 family)
MGMARDMMGGGAAAGLRPGAGPAGAPVALDKSDFDAFERTLQEVQAAWTRRDLDALRRLATPEMVGFFEDDYAALDARGWRNEVRDVKLEQGDLSEAWREDGREYATVAMRFSLVDVTRSVKDGAVTEGDPAKRTEATELWTFVRPVSGRWVLSAIQQTG